MFGKKRRKTECQIIARDASGATLLAQSASEFQLPEDVTLDLSIEFFNDPQPCEIHRAAVRWRAIQQLQESCQKNVDIPLSSLDEGLRRFFPSEARFIQIAEAAP